MCFYAQFHRLHPAPRLTSERPRSELAGRPVEGSIGKGTLNAEAGRVDVMAANREERWIEEGRG